MDLLRSSSTVCVLDERTILRGTRSINRNDLHACQNLGKKQKFPSPREVIVGIADSVRRKF